MSDPVLRRDAAVIGLVGGAHFLSHFFQLSVAPLFPLIKTELGVSYTALGLIVTVFYGTSLLCQTPAGFLVDRFGARRMLIGGLALLSAAIGLAGLAPGYWALLPVASLAGMGNSVFHPSDYAILNARVSPSRLGQAYGVHSIGGTLGWAAAPAVVLPVATFWGWRRALMVAALLGLIAATVLVWQRGRLDERVVTRRPAGGPHPAPAAASQIFLSPPILASFGYFALTSFSFVGVQTFMTSALLALYEAPLAVATGTLTGFLVATAAGVLVGGRLADRTSRHDLVAMTGVASGAALMLMTATGALAVPAAVALIVLAGFAVGVTSPSRDMLVRAATPPGASGRVFGFVYSGLDLGSSTGPLLFGWLLDHGEPRLVFAAVAAGFVLCVFAVHVRVRTAPSPAVS